MDPGIAKLIERTRARRGELAELSSDRSPLPSEARQRDRSPLKQTRSPSKLSSPLKSRNVDITVEDSPSKKEVKRILSRESLETSVKDLISRESPGKSFHTRTTVSSAASPQKTTVTKTVITEKEESYERKETITYSGNKELFDKFQDKFDNLERIDSGPEKENAVVDSATFTKKLDTAPTVPGIKKTEIRVAEKAPKPTESEVPAAETNSPLDWEAGRRARLANLASKFRHIDDESPPIVREVQLPKPVVKPAPRAPSPSKHAPVRTDHLRGRSPTKQSPLNPNQFISPQRGREQPQSASPARTRSVRFVSPTKSALALSPRAVSPCKSPEKSPEKSPRKSPDKSPVKSPVKNLVPTRKISPAKPTDASFVGSLKAQGFQESDSKSKLVYDFQSDLAARERSPSPTPAAARARSPSPTRPANPFLAADRERGRAPVRQVVVGTGAGTGQFVQSGPRQVSPSKPHPLQFVSPSKEHQPPAPPKPSRTFEAAPAQSGPTPQWKLKLKNSQVKSQVEADAANDRVDSPAMKSVSQKRDMFEGGATPPAELPDPALLSMSQRKAMFEKNKSVPTPIARFGESVTPAMLQAARPQEAGLTPAEAWKRKRELSPAKRPAPRPPISTPKVPQPAAVPTQQELLDTPSTAGLGRKTTEMQKKLFEANQADWRDNDIAKKASEEKQTEMNLLLNRYNHLRNHTEDPTAQPAAPPAPPSPPKEEVYYPGVNSMKRVKVSPPKAGQLYPHVDFESDTLSSRPDSVMSTDTLNSSIESAATHASEAPSLGREIVAAARPGPVEQELFTIPESNNDSMDTDDGDDIGEIDDMLDEAIDNEEDHPSPAKLLKSSSSSSGSDQHILRSESTTSWEFHTPQPGRPAPQPSRYQTPLVTPASPVTSGQEVEIEGEEGPLLHTVSFYRKQKPETPVQRIVLNPRLEVAGPEVVESPRASIAQRIHRLQEEAGSQMPVIQQASSALNLCRATKEFFGSSEQVEGERLLLVASHKRAAALSEVDRLKTEGGLGAEPGADTSVRGTVSLCGVTLGLKREFVQQVRSGEAGDFLHYFLCLVKCAGQVIPTQMVSSSEGLDGAQLHFPNLINFRDLSKDFKIQLEVYGLQTKKEHLTHDAKYHIKKGKQNLNLLNNLTPKLKMNKTESKLSRPGVSSPGGPHTVRTSSFAMVGHALITIGSLARKEWSLERVPPISPLDGNISFKLNCHSESQVSNRGFLTMFDDVSGFGAWHRRWFVLQGNTLSFWKYPENEKAMEPIGRLDLGEAVTGEVGIAPREVCSRMHTFMLETERPAAREDRDSLVVVRRGGSTTLRHLLSADSRQERVAWCDILNRALDNLRAWDTARPRSGSQSSCDSVETTGTSTSTEIW